MFPALWSPTIATEVTGEQAGIGTVGIKLSRGYPQVIVPYAPRSDTNTIRFRRFMTA